jgi:hypothetical protein
MKMITRCVHVDVRTRVIIFRLVRAPTASGREVGRKYREVALRAISASFIVMYVNRTY